MIIESNSHIRFRDNTGNIDFAKMTNGGSVELYYDNSKKFETTSAGVTITGHLTLTGEIFANEDIGLADNRKITFGAGGDLQILHESSTGYNYINFVNGPLIFRDNTTNRAFFHANDGHFMPWDTNTYDLGGTSNRWRNIYTNDLHLSNEGHSNDVDGTWGNWTIQEGESDLFLKNNRSGKKYKFNLTEVA